MTMSVMHWAGKAQPHSPHQFPRPPSPAGRHLQLRHWCRSPSRACDCRSPSRACDCCQCSCLGTVTSARFRGLSMPPPSSTPTPSRYRCHVTLIPCWPCPHVLAPCPWPHAPWKMARNGHGPHQALCLSSRPGRHGARARFPFYTDVW